MLKVSKAALTGIVVLCMVAVVLCVKGFGMAQVPLVKRPVAAGRTFGVADARVKIEEFTDFQCPACAATSVIVHDEMKKEGSRIFFELKYFPLSMHKHSRAAAVVAQCALKQGMFWPMQEALFRTQKVWGVMQDPTDHFLGLARGIGADDQKIMRCMLDKTTDLNIEEDVNEGKRRGVNATPTFFVNGKMAIGGVNFEAALKEALK